MNRNSVLISAVLGLLASLVMGALARYAAIQQGVVLPLLSVMIGGALGGAVGNLVGRWGERGAPNGSAAVIRIFFSVLLASVLTGAFSIAFLRQILFPGVPIQFSGMALLGWSIGVFAGGGWLAILALVREENPQPPA